MSWTVSSEATVGHRILWKALIPQSMHQAMAARTEHCVCEIRQHRQKARKRGVAERIRWPLIVLRALKGWTAPKAPIGGMELSPHLSSVRERVHFESSLEQKSFIRVRGATNPATRRNPVDYHASRVLNGTGEIESGTQAPQLRIGRWKQACCCSTGKLPVRVASICNGRFL